MLLARSKVPYSDFLPHVMAFVQGDTRPGMSSEAAASFIRNSAIKFATASGILIKDVTVKLQSGMHTYPLFLVVGEESDEKIIRVVSAYHSETNADIVLDGFEDDCITLSSTPDGCDLGSIIVRVVAVPTRTSCKVDELLFNDWHDAIINGALSEIHMMPQQPWTSGGAAQDRTRLFRQDVSRARIRVANKGLLTERLQGNSRWSNTCGICS